MADDATRRYLDSLSPAELAQLQALADKRNQSLEMMADIIRKQNEARSNIINKMR